MVDVVDLTLARAERQEIEGDREAIPGGYVLQAKNQVGFQLAAYDTSKPLVIDPVLVYSTYGGDGSNEIGQRRPHCLRGVGPVIRGFRQERLD